MSNNLLSNPLVLDSPMSTPDATARKILRIDWDLSDTASFPRGPDGWCFSGDVWFTITDQSGNPLLNQVADTNKVGSVVSLDFLYAPLDWSNGLQLTKLDFGVLRIWWEA